LEYADIQGWIITAKATADLVKTAASLLPKGPKRAEIEAALRINDEAMQRADARLAKDLGLRLCSCTFPPQIMLWKEALKADVCPNPECNRTLPRGMRISKELLDEASRPGPNSWMAR
jgi:hypothetical protein